MPDACGDSDAAGVGPWAVAVVAVVAADAHAVRQVASAATAMVAVVAVARAGPGALTGRRHPIPGFFAIYSSFRFRPVIADPHCRARPDCSEREAYFERPDECNHGSARHQGKAATLQRAVTASAAMKPAAIAATAKPPCAPEAFTAQPAAAAAPADPAALAEFSQAKAWVSTARWTAASASTEHKTRITGIASPVSTTPKPSSNGEPATSSGRQPAASPVAATASCTRGAVRHRRSPYSQPASRLAQLDTVKSTAAM